MTSFIINNIDYIFFIFIISLLTLVTTSYLLKRVQPSNALWSYLGLACFFYMISVLFVILRGIRGYEIMYLNFFEILFAFLAFYSFLEYARLETRRKFGINIHRYWFVAILALSIATGLLIGKGMVSVNIAIRILVGVCSCWWVAYIVLRVMPIERKQCSISLAISIFIFSFLFSFSYSSNI
ncbi:MAG TPA: hypothetical protein PK443_04650, partial [bacterium]|nr:hypothetical protein [bacterium]